MPTSPLGPRLLKLMLAGVLACWVPGRLSAQPVEPSAAGFYTVQLSSRAFDSSPFGAGTTGRALLSFTQGLKERGSLSFWLEQGLGSVSQDIGLELRDVPLWGGYGQVNAGDFLFQPLLPRRSAVTPTSVRELYPLQGLSLQHTGGRSQWGAFAGRAKRFRELPGVEIDFSAPVLYGLQHLRRFGTQYVGVALTGVARATFAEGRAGRAGETGVVSGTYYRQVSPQVGVLAQSYAHLRGGVGGRAGARFRRQAAQVSASVYAFGSGFPFVFPLYRPGEGGVTMTSQLRLDEFTSLFAYIDYVLATQVDERGDLRAEVGVGRSLGSNRPHFYLSYAHNELVFDAERVITTGRTADVFALAVTQNTAAQLTNLRVEHMIQRQEARTTLTRADLFYRRLFRSRSFMNLTSTALRSTNRNYRVAAEVALERPLWRRFRYLVGVGATYRQNPLRRTGEGTMRLGLERRITRNGLSVRVEAARQFPIGLPRSEVPAVRLAFDLGHRLTWRDLDSFEETLFPERSSGPTGIVEGTVMFDGEGVARVTVYINGEPRAVTNAQGYFRVRRVPLGGAYVRLDIREFETEYGVLGGPVQQVEVTRGQVARVNFELAVLRYFQGSVVVCEDGQMRPLVNATLTLRGQGVRREVGTSRVGGFQFDELPPGLYDLTLTPVPEDETRLGDAARNRAIDLRDQDLAGYLVRLNCE